MVLAQDMQSTMEFTNLNHCIQAPLGLTLCCAPAMDKDQNIPELCLENRHHLSGEPFLKGDCSNLLTGGVVMDHLDT